MISSVQFSSKSLELLQLRKLDNKEIADFSAILQKASASQSSAKDFLNSLSAQELTLIQKANSLADNIYVNDLSTEGAQNLLSQPDGSDRVDLNNDGIVEVGAGRTIQFPPVNAPQHVKDAWLKSIEGMDEGEVMMLQLSLHLSVYGANIEGIPKKTPLSPEQQWSEQGISELFNKLYGSLEFRVNREGWTEHNLMLKDFYQRFEQQLTTSAHSAVTGSGNSDADKSVNSMQESINQLILDARIGLDREKLEEIEQKIKEVENNPNLSAKEKEQLLQALQAEKDELIEKAAQRMKEQEKQLARARNLQLLTQG